MFVSLSTNVPEKSPGVRTYPLVDEQVVLDSSQHTVGYLSSILNARVYDLVKETPLEHAVALSEKLKNTVLLKREVQGPVQCWVCG